MTFSLATGVELLYFNGFENTKTYRAPAKDECRNARTQKRYYDFNQITRKSLAWEVWKGTNGRTWIENKTINVYRGLNSLGLHLGNKRGKNSGCNNTQKIEVMTVNASSKDRSNKFIFNFGQVRYVGFAVKLGESTDPNRVNYFESPDIDKSFNILAQIRQDSAKNFPGPPLVSMQVKPHSDTKKVSK